MVDNIFTDFFYVIIPGAILTRNFFFVLALKSRGPKNVEFRKTPEENSVIQQVWNRHQYLLPIILLSLPFRLQNRLLHPGESKTLSPVRLKKKVLTII